MQGRRKAREAALQALYQCDSLKTWDLDQIDLFFSVFFKEELQNESFKNENFKFCKVLINKVIECKSNIDKIISGASIHWSLQRMARVDRNILRIAVAELLYFRDIPASVSINEAIEVAKRFCAEEAPVFINGVLDKVAQQKGVAKYDKNERSAKIIMTTKVVNS